MARDGSRPVREHAEALLGAAQGGTQQPAERLPVELRRGGARRLGQRLLDADGHQSPVSGSGISSASSIRVEARSSSPLSILPPFRVHSACAWESRRMRRESPSGGRAHLDQLAVPAADVEDHRAVVVALRVRPLHLPPLGAVGVDLGRPGAVAVLRDQGQLADQRELLLVEPLGERQRVQQLARQLGPDHRRPGAEDVALAEDRDRRPQHALGALAEHRRRSRVAEQAAELVADRHPRTLAGAALGKMAGRAARRAAPAGRARRAPAAAWSGTRGRRPRPPARRMPGSSVSTSAASSPTLRATYARGPCRRRAV